MRAIGGLGALAHKRKNYTEAIMWSERAYSLNSASDAAIWNLAMAYEAAEYLEKSKKFYGLYISFSTSKKNSDFARKKVKLLAQKIDNTPRVEDR